MMRTLPSDAENDSLSVFVSYQHHSRLSNCNNQQHYQSSAAVVIAGTPHHPTLHSAMPRLTHRGRSIEIANAANQPLVSVACDAVKRSWMSAYSMYLQSNDTCVLTLALISPCYSISAPRVDRTLRCGEYRTFSCRCCLLLLISSLEDAARVR